MRGQKLYSFIIRKNNRLLAQINTNRRYAPSDLLTNRGRIKAGMAYCYRKLFRNSQDAYNLELGLEGFMRNNWCSLKNNEFINSKSLAEDYHRGSWKNNRIEFYKALSFAFWYDRNLK
jgi:hypothetical protein